MIRGEDISSRFRPITYRWELDAPTSLEAKVENPYVSISAYQRCWQLEGEEALAS